MRILRAGETDAVSAAIRSLRAGGLVGVPTSRWYMVCADAGNEAACASIFQAKRRPLTKSLALVFSQTCRLADLFDIPEDLLTVLDAFSPGPVAYRLRWRTTQRKRYAAVGDPIALVTIADGALGNLVDRFGQPLAATSINVSGDAGPDDPGPAIDVREVESVVTDTGLPLEICLDGGITPLFTPMTIVDASSGHLRVERHGLVHVKALKAVQPNILVP